MICVLHTFISDQQITYVLNISMFTFKTRQASKEVLVLLCSFTSQGHMGTHLQSTSSPFRLLEGMIEW